MKPGHLSSKLTEVSLHLKDTCASCCEVAWRTQPTLGRFCREEKEKR